MLKSTPAWKKKYTTAGGSRRDLYQLCWFGHIFSLQGSYRPKVNTSDLHFAWSYQGFLIWPNLMRTKYVPKYRIWRILVYVSLKRHWANWKSLSHSLILDAQVLKLTQTRRQPEKLTGLTPKIVFFTRWHFLGMGRPKLWKVFALCTC